MGYVRVRYMCGWFYRQILGNSIRWTISSVFNELKEFFEWILFLSASNDKLLWRKKQNNLDDGISYKLYLESSPLY